MMTRRMFVATGAAAGLLRATEGAWPLWEFFAPRLVDAQGRVIDRHAGNHTTSEGQSYALFFALVAGDRSRFEHVLDWTQNNLGGGDLSARLPAWLYGQAAGGGGAPDAIVDANSASDGDLWLAYTLIEAGRLWGEARYARIGQALATRIAQQEVRDIAGLGTMLLPGARGFTPQPGLYYLNPSYLPLQLLYGLAQAQPRGPWRRIAQNTPQVVQGAAPAGVALDWISWSEALGFVTAPVMGGRARAGFDAIRVYLWAGMLDAGTPGRWQMLQSLRGVLNHLRAVAFPAATLKPDGAVEDAASPLCHSAALLPYLRALDEREILQRQRLRVKQRLESNRTARYYDMCLALFALGWLEGRFRFDAQGKLVVGGNAR